MCLFTECADCSDNMAMTLDLEVGDIAHYIINTAGDYCDGLVSYAEMRGLIVNDLVAVWEKAYTHGFHDRQADAGLTLDEMED